MIRLLLSPIVITCVLATCLHVFVYYSGYTFTPGTLADPDGYMRLLRVEQLLETGRWYDQSIRLANAPFGHPLPWGRFLDLIILVIYFPLSFFKESREALFTAGVWVSPLLLIPCGVALAWAKQQYQLSRDFCLAALALYLMQPALVNYYVAARPDHHALLITLFLIQVVIVFGCLKRSSWMGGFVVAGILMGGSCWVSIEPLAMWVATTCVFALLWLFQPGCVRQVVAFHASTLIVSMAGLLLETPQAIWNAPVADRLSGYYLILFLVTMLGWCGIWCLSKKVPSQLFLQRVALGVSVGLLAVGMVCYLANPIINGPMGAIPPEILKIWWPRLDEFQPVGSTPAGILDGLFTWLSVTILALPYVVIRGMHLVKQNRNLEMHEYGWIIYAVIFTALIFYQKRWSSYAEIIWIIPAALFTANVLKTLSLKENMTMWRVPCLFVLLMIPFIPKGLMSLVSDSTEGGPVSQVPVYHEQELIEWVESLPATKTLLSPFNVSPQLMYFTGHHTVGGNYHTNAAGIRDSYEFWMTSDLERAAAILGSRNVDYVIIESDMETAGFHKAELGDTTMFRRLLDKDPPEFLSFYRECGGYLIFQVGSG